MESRARGFVTWLKDYLDAGCSWSRSDPTGGEPHPHRLSSKMAALAELASSPRAIRFFEEFLAKEAVELDAKIGAAHAEDLRVLDLS